MLVWIGTPAKLSLSIMERFVRTAETMSQDNPYDFMQDFDEEIESSGITSFAVLASPNQHR